jgi:hypothetical protein
MRQNRLPRLLGALGLAVSLAGGMLTTALAAPAPLLVSGTDYSPVVISWGGIGVFHVKAENDPNQTSNISQLYLTELSGASVYGYADANKDGTALPANPWCSAIGTPLTCSFGSLAPGEWVEFTVALVAPTSVSSWPVDFEYSTSGYVTGKNQSHGDKWDVTFTESLASTGDTSNAAGTYVWDNSIQQKPVHDGLNLGQNNRQSTTVTSPTTGIAVSVQDGSTSFPTGQDCQSTAAYPCPTTFFGEVSIIEVNDELAVTNASDCLSPAVWIWDSPAQTSGQCAFPVVIDYYHGPSPNQVHGVYHNWLDGSVLEQQYITDVCATPSAPGPTPCFYAEKIGPNLQITVWFFHNGNTRAF